MYILPKIKGETLDEYAKRVRADRARREKVRLYRPVTDGLSIGEPNESILDAAERKALEGRT